MAVRGRVEVEALRTPLKQATPVRGRVEVEALRTPLKQVRNILPHKGIAAAPTTVINQKTKTKASVGVHKSNKTRLAAGSAQSAKDRPLSSYLKQKLVGHLDDDSSVSSSTSTSHSSGNSISCIQRNEDDEMSASTSTWGLGTGSALNCRLRSMSGTSEWDTELQQMSLLEFEDVEEQWREERKAEEQQEESQQGEDEDALIAQRVPHVTHCSYPSRTPIDLTGESEEEGESEVDCDGFPSNVLSGTSAIEAGTSQSECHLEGSFSMRSSMPYEPSFSLNTNMTGKAGTGAGNTIGIVIDEDEDDQDHVLFGTYKSSYSDSDSNSNSKSNKSAGEGSNETNSNMEKLSSTQCKKEEEEEVEKEKEEEQEWDLKLLVSGKIDILGDLPNTHERVWGAEDGDNVKEEKKGEEEEEEEEERDGGRGNEDVDNAKEVKQEEDDVSVDSSSTVSASSTATMIRILKAAGLDQCLSPLDSLRSIDFSCCDFQPSQTFLIENGTNRVRDNWVGSRNRKEEGGGERERSGRGGQIRECNNGWVHGQHSPSQTSQVECPKSHHATDESSSTAVATAMAMAMAMEDSYELHKSIVVRESFYCLFLFFILFSYRSKGPCHAM